MPDLPSDDGEWIEVPKGDSLQSAGGRIEVLATTVGVGESIFITDPDHEHEGNPAGVESQGRIVMLDLHGHLHPGGYCIPVSAPFLLSPEAVDSLIGSLTEARDKLLELNRESGRG